MRWTSAAVIAADYACRMSASGVGAHINLAGTMPARRGEAAHLAGAVQPGMCSRCSCMNSRAAATASSLSGKLSVIDGPFVETKEMDPAARREAPARRDVGLHARNGSATQVTLSSPTTAQDIFKSDRAIYLGQRIS